MGHKDETSEILYIIYVRNVGNKCRNWRENKITGNVDIEKNVENIIQTTHEHEDSSIGLNIRPKLMKMIKERNCRYYGHSFRLDKYDYVCLLLECTVDSKNGRARGRPRNAWSSNIRDWMIIDYTTLAGKAHDYDLWWSMASKEPDGYGTAWLINEFEHCHK